MPPSVSIIIPVYNEKQAAESLAARLSKLFTLVQQPLEVIVVDDGSTDGTSDILSRIQLENVKVNRHEKNRGYGAALKTGVSASAHEWIGITDCDATYPDERFPDLINVALEKSLDLVIGARDAQRIPALRRFPKYILRRLASYLIGFDIPDLNSGMRVIRKETLLKYMHFYPDQFSFTSTNTITFLGKRHGVTFVPIEYYTREGKSKIRPIRDTIGFFHLICRTCLWMNPMRVFLPLSVGLILLSFLILLLSWIVTGKPMDTTFGVVFIGGVQIFGLGMLADLIDNRLG